MRKPILLNIVISVKHEKQSKNMCILTTLNVVILQLRIRHPHPVTIQSCYLITMSPSGGEFLPLLSYIYQFIIKSLNFYLDNCTTIWRTFLCWRPSSMYSIQSNNSCIYQHPFSFYSIRKEVCSQFIYSCVCREVFILQFLRRCAVTQNDYLGK